MRQFQLVSSALCLAIASVGSGCGSDTAAPTAAAPAPAPPKGGVPSPEETAKVVSFPSVGHLFKEQKPFMFEVTGAPVEFNLQVTWRSTSPFVVGGPAGDVLYDTAEEIQKNAENGGVAGEITKGEKGRKRGFVALLLPKKPTSSVELHLKRGHSYFGIGETLQDVLPAEASEMRATGTWVQSGTHDSFEEDVYSVGPGETIKLVTVSQIFEADERTRYLTYTLSARGVGEER